MAAAVVQHDFLVPSSRSPPKREWTHHYWYVMFAAAMQARPDLPDDEAALLVQFFRSMQVALCCPTCKDHYKTNFSACPYKLGHAKDLSKSTQWVRNLRFTVEDQVLRAKSSGSGSGSGVAPTTPTAHASCVPPFPGAVFSGATASCTKLHEQLDAALARSVSTIDTNGGAKECACNTGGRAYRPPLW